MKSGAFRIMSQRYGAAMLHDNTHLYVSEADITDFPGSRYRIDELLPFSSSAIKTLARRRIGASVSVRNFDMTADTLRARLRCRESSSTRLIGVTTASGRYMIIASAIASDTTQQSAITQPQQHTTP